MYKLLENLAIRHRITCARKFGNAWIGCVGFFKSWDSNAVNCFEGLFIDSIVVDIVKILFLFVSLYAGYHAFYHLSTYLL